MAYLRGSIRLPALVVVGCLCLALGGSQPVTAAPAESSAYHIVVSQRALGAGESVELRLVPPPPAGARVNYSVMSGAAGLSLLDGFYRAPYVIALGTPPVRVTASFSTAAFRASATTEIELVPGSLPVAEDCLGPGQSFSSVMAEIEPTFTHVDELPQLIRSVEPNYPASAFARGIEDTIHIKALLCRSGRVLDAYALPIYRGGIGADAQPVDQDPKLIEAALAAVRQYVFSPGRLGGQPVAQWVHTGVAFRR